MIYKVVCSEIIGFAHEDWLIVAGSLSEAITKAFAKMNRSKEFRHGWKLTSACEVGELTK